MTGCPHCNNPEYYETALSSCSNCGWNGEYCEKEDCQECCPHDEYDHGICLGCGKDCTDDLVSAAEYRYEGDR